MESIILETAVSQGIWAVLTVALLIHIAKSNDSRDARQEEREEKYQKLLSELSEKFSIVTDIKSDLNEIKTFFLQQK